MRPFEVVYQEAPILENQEEDVQSGWAEVIPDQLEADLEDFKETHEQQV